MDPECCTLGTVVTGTDRASEATAQSSSTGHRRGESPSARMMHSMVEDGETALLRAFEEIGQGQLFPAADEQERRDISDSRNHGRGQKTRRKRLEKGWLVLKRARAADQRIADELGADQPTTEQTGTEQPASEQPPTNQPATEQPTFQQPGLEQPAVEQPAVEQPVVDESTELSDGELVMDEVQCVVDELIDDVACGGTAYGEWQKYEDVMDPLRECGWVDQYELPPAFGYYVLRARSGGQHQRFPQYEDVLSRLKARGDYIEGRFDEAEYDRLCDFHIEGPHTHHTVDHIVDAWLGWRECDSWSSWRAEQDADQIVSGGADEPTHAYLFESPCELFRVFTADGRRSLGESMWSGRLTAAEQRMNSL